MDETHRKSNIRIKFLQGFSLCCLHRTTQNWTIILKYFAKQQLCFEDEFPMCSEFSPLCTYIYDYIKQQLYRNDRLWLLARYSWPVFVASGQVAPWKISPCFRENAAPISKSDRRRRCPAPSK